MSASRPPSPAAAQVRLLGRVGSGPLADVLVGVRETDAGAGPVTLKVLRERTPRDLAAVWGAVRSSRALASLRHRHLAPVERALWVGAHLAVEAPYIDGLHLGDLVSAVRDRGQRVPPRAALEVLRATASGLDAGWRRTPVGHELPLTLAHRDLKPTNIVVDRDGGVRVLDHATGFMSLAGRDARAGAIKQGLARYLAPERRDGRRADHVGDVYALGAMAIELLHGAPIKRPSATNPAHDRYVAELVAELPAADLRTAAQAALRNLLLRMVAHDPDARPTAAEAAMALRRILDGAGGMSLDELAATVVAPRAPSLPASPDPSLADVEIRPVTADDEETSKGRRVDLERALTELDDAPWEETATGWSKVEDNVPTATSELLLEPTGELTDELFPPGLTADLVPTEGTAELDVDPPTELTADGLTSELEETGWGDGLTSELRDAGPWDDDPSSWSSDGLTDELAAASMPPDPAASLPPQPLLKPAPARKPASTPTPRRRPPATDARAWWFALIGLALSGAFLGVLGAIALLWATLS